MNPLDPRTLAALIAGLSALLRLFPRVAMAGLSMPTGALVIAAEVLAAVVLVRLAWRARGGFWLRPRMTEAAA